MNRQFKTKIYQGRGRGQSRNFYNKQNYNQWGYQNRYRSNTRDRRIQLVVRVEVDQDMNRIIAEEILVIVWGHIKILGDITEEDIKEIIGMKIIAEKWVEVGLEKDYF